MPEPIPVAKILCVNLLILLNSVDNNEFPKPNIAFHARNHSHILYLRSPFSFLLYFLYSYVHCIHYLLPSFSILISFAFSYNWTLKNVALKHISFHIASVINETQQMNLYNWICNYFKLRILKRKFWSFSPKKVSSRLMELFCRENISLLSEYFQ